MGAAQTRFMKCTALDGTAATKLTLDADGTLVSSASVGAGTYSVTLPAGFGHFNQLTMRVEVATVTGGSDALDVKLQYRMAGTWLDVTGGAVTQMTAADTETVIVARSTAATTWSDDLKLVVVVAAGATATVLECELVGAVA